MSSNCWPPLLTASKNPSVFPHEVMAHLYTEDVHQDSRFGSTLKTAHIIDIDIYFLTGSQFFP